MGAATSADTITASNLPPGFTAASFTPGANKNAQIAIRYGFKLSGLHFETGGVVSGRVFSEHTSGFFIQPAGTNIALFIPFFNIASVVFVP